MSLQEKIAIIVGAGASKEFSFPIGSELKGSIAQMLDIRFENGHRQISGDYSVMDAFRYLANINGENPNEYLRAARSIRDAMPLAPSIDQFIHSQRGNKLIEKCGKVAIVRAILSAEQNSTLHRDRYSDVIGFPNVQNTWLNALFRVLVDGCTKDELDERFSAVSLIVFNYDRCIEQFLFYSLKSYFPMGDQRAAELVGKLRVYHPYGSVGVLPWMGGTEGLEFGAQPSTAQLLELSEGIKTFTEGTDPSSSELSRIRKALGRSPRVLFLGFAYHPLNLELLAPSDVTDAATSRRLIGTAYGLSDADCREIKRELADSFLVAPENVELRNELTAAKVFDEYTRAVSFRSI